jgi:uncharacterized coiled-coil protein SlyX
MRRPAPALLAWSAVALAALALAAPAGADEGRRLYRYTDDDGVVRYTPDPGRAGGAQVELVEPGMSMPPAAVVAPPAPAAAPVAPGEFEPEPFNAPESARPVSAEPAVASAAAGPSPLDARIAEMEAAIARDEETLKSLVSTPVEGESDPLLDSDELREIARRLPELQANLEALRQQRARQIAR